MQRRDPVPSPSDFIDPLFTCGSFLPGNPNNDNTAEFCDPQIDTQAQQALTCQIRDPAAAGQWTDIDRELADQAPWVPLYNPLDLTVLSARAGNYQFNPYWELLIDQLWSVSDIRSNPKELGASAYDFTKQLLTSQPKFTEKRVEDDQAAAGRQETPQSARVAPSTIRTYG